MTEQNKNYNLEYKNIVKEIDNKGIKPKLFLHACCGPCLTYPLTELVNHFDVIVGYINQNIYPKEEYDRREETLRRFVKEFNEENNLNVEVISLPYDYDSFFPLIEKYGPIREGLERCTFCHWYRMNKAYKYANDNYYEYFATVMTVSSKKPSAILNEIGISLNKEYTNTKFLVSDFKKEDGQLKGIRIAKAHNMYRQDYCGCSYSLEARKNYLKEKKL